MKRCFKCGESKALSAFYAHKEMRDGFLSKCKECTKADVRAHYRSNISKIKDYDKARAMLPHRVAARKRYIQSDAGRAAYNRAHRASFTKYPERKRATDAVNNAVRDGKLKKLPCFVCGEKAEAHHPAYSQPLDVVWLCNTHHREAHAIVKAA